MNISKEDMEKLKEKYQSFCQALIDKNMEEIDSMLPDNFVAVHITGKRQTKEEWLADIKNGEMNYYAFENVKYSFSTEQEKVKMAITQNIRAKIYGASGTWSIPGEWSFVKDGNDWKMVV